MFKDCLYLVVVATLVWATVSHGVELHESPKLVRIADELVAEDYYTRPQIEALLSQATVKQSVIDAMTNPAEYVLTWGKYRKIFMDQERIDYGVQFWNEYRPYLERAEREYGVPVSIIVAIIGVETKFGRIKGKHKVLDSLVSLVVGYPRRSEFFAKELKHFLILTKENGMDATQVLGSYAGAVGYPQFISSSYRSYAVDFSGDGKVDLIDQPIDAIGSVANYFKENGWRPGGAVTSQAHFSVNSDIAELANRKRKTKFTAAELRNKGAAIDDTIADEERLNVIMLNASEQTPDSDDRGVYIVRSGDTVCQIAERYSVPCRELFTLNRLDSKGTIYRGQRLKLPKADASSSESVSSPPETKQVRTGKWVVNQVVPAAAANSEPVQQPQELPRYFYTHHNFYAITAYNHSVLYAMAVYDLSIALAEAWQQALQLTQ